MHLKCWYFKLSFFICWFFSPYKKVHPIIFGPIFFRIFPKGADLLIYGLNARMANHDVRLGKKMTQFCKTHDRLFVFTWNSIPSQNLQQRPPKKQKTRARNNQFFFLVLYAFFHAWNFPVVKKLWWDFAKRMIVFLFSPEIRSSLKIFNNAH